MVYDSEYEVKIHRVYHVMTIKKLIQTIPGTLAILHNKIKLYTIEYEQHPENLNNIKL